MVVVFINRPVTYGGIHWNAILVVWLVLRPTSQFWQTYFESIQRYHSLQETLSKMTLVQVFKLFYLSDGWVSRSCVELVAVFPCYKERIPQFGDEKYPPTITAVCCCSSSAYGLQHPRSFLTESVLGFNHTTKDFRRNHITKGFWNHPQPKEEQQQSPHCTYTTTAGTVPTHGRSANALAGFHHLLTELQIIIGMKICVIPMQ